MFRNVFTFLLFFATVFFQAEAKSLDATFDLVRFKTTGKQQLVELYCSVNGNSVIYKKVAGGFQASVALEVQFSDSTGVKHFDKLVLKSPVLADSAVAKNAFNLQKRIPLQNGKYTFTAKAQDLNGKHPASVLETPLVLDFKETEIQISDVQLLESYSKTNEQNEYTKNGFKLMSYVSNFYPKGFDALKFYAEIYNAEAVLGKDKTMVVFFRIFPARDNLSKIILSGQKVMKAAPVNVVLNEMDISTLASGNYELVIDVRNEANVTVIRQKRSFQRSNPMTTTEELAKLGKDELPAVFAQVDSAKLDVYLLSLKPLANATEGTFVESVVKSGTTFQKRSYLHSFWKKRSETNPEKAWSEYRDRVDYVQKTFANKTFNGYETDLGRVYLQYGPPSKISNERNDVNRPINNTDTKPYQIWQYYQLGKQRNRVFVFLQRNLGNPNYSLVHSTAIGEVADNEWRKQAGVRFSGNGANDRNSRQNRTFDNEGNEIQNYKHKGPQ